MMKRISFYKYLLITIIIAGIYSCKDMMDFHKEFVKDGEIVYLSKMDSMVSYPGKNRIQLSGYLSNAYNVNKVVVYWNSRADSMSFDYTNATLMDSLNLMIPNLEEKSYIFDIYTLNAAGNRSIKVSIAGTVYGDFYRGNLAPRTSNGFSFDGTVLKSLWLSADDLERGTSIRYTTDANIVETVFLSRDLASIDLPKQKYGTPISFQSIFVPEKAAVDTFLSAWITKPVVYNPYVGNYLSAGTIVDPVTGVRVINRDKFIKRIDDVTSELEVADKGISKYTMKLKVNADNTVTLTPSGSTPNIDQSYGINKYDPATKTFTLNYAYDIAAPRVISEVISRTYIEKVIKTGWTITGFSTEEPGEGAPNGLASAAIDDKLNTFWHTQWDGASPGYPHWFSFDMGKEVSVASIEVFRRQGNGGGQTKHQFFYSINGTDWIDYGTFAMNKDTNDGQKFRCSTGTATPTARYIKYVALTGGNFYAFLAEINVYSPMP